MSSPKPHAKSKLASVKPTGTWTPPSVNGGNAPASKNRPGSVTVTILGTPLQPKHISRDVLKAAVRSVK